MLAATAGAVVAYGDAGQHRTRKQTRSRPHCCTGAPRRAPSTRAVQIPRGQGGEFALRAKINGVCGTDGDRHRRDLRGADL